MSTIRSALGGAGDAGSRRRLAGVLTVLVLSIVVYQVVLAEDLCALRVYGHGGRVDGTKWEPGTNEGSVSVEGLPATQFRLVASEADLTAENPKIVGYAFCTDMDTTLGLGSCNAIVDHKALSPGAACVLQYYPPDLIDVPDTATSKELDLEAAARQAAVWHYTNGFILSEFRYWASVGGGDSELAKTRVTEILADIEGTGDIEGRLEKGECAAPSTALDGSHDVDLTITAPTTTLEPGDTPYLTISLKVNGSPLAGQVVTVWADNSLVIFDEGALQTDGSVLITTGSGGIATVAMQVGGGATQVTSVTVYASVDLRLPVNVAPGMNVQTVALIREYADGANFNIVYSCSLTPGYWKTHSEYGPAPYDSTWALLPDGADTEFLASGQSYLEVLLTPPKGGNAYYILAHAYIATYLNLLKGAYLNTAVADAYQDAAAALLSAKPDAKLDKDIRADWLEWASLLDAYNNGIYGPGHCE